MGIPAGEEGGRRVHGAVRPPSRGRERLLLLDEDGAAGHRCPEMTPSLREDRPRPHPDSPGEPCVAPPLRTARG